VFGAVGIDMVAGVSEILVIADASANPDWVAIDLFSQAEHDELAQAILLSPDRALLDAVEASMRRWLASMPRAAIIAASLAKRGALIQVRDLAEACDVSNRIAPEHLELAVADPEALLPRVRHAGAIFVGHHASEALGDYCAGPNHVLPTGRTARFSSPLGVYDFQKRSSVLRISAAAARTLGPVAATLAHGEGLVAHARSAEAAGHAPARARRSNVSDVAARVAATVRDDIRATPRTRRQAVGMIELHANENPWPLPASLRGEIAATVAEAAVNRYPEGAGERVKEALAARCPCRRAPRSCSATAPTS
jgi:hypothetical protein